MEAREMLERMAAASYAVFAGPGWSWKTASPLTRRIHKDQIQTALRELVDIETWQAKSARERWLSVLAITELEL